MMLTDSPLIKCLGKLSLDEVVGAAIADEIGGADGADSSACQSNGMAAAVRRTEEEKL